MPSIVVLVTSVGATVRSEGVWMMTRRAGALVERQSDNNGDFQS